MDEALPLPGRCIFDDVDMKSFMESPTKVELMNFVKSMGKACASKGIGDSSFDPIQPLMNLPPSMACLHGSLQEMVSWVDDFPPETALGDKNASSIRYGNPQFRSWHERLVERSDAIITTILQTRDSHDITTELACQHGKDAASGILQPKSDSSVSQVSCYLHTSFGDHIRLDYGTGHESSFLVLLLILSKVKCIGETPSLITMRALSISMFDQYLKVTRRLQVDYRLEPAGSHGVWGIDDYHCLPFYFGSCQLQGICESNVKGATTSHELLEPRCIMDEHTIREYGDSLMYIGCIRYIRKIKKGAPFFESSPMLYDISQTLPSWDRVARGLIRLYEGEVLDKRVVVQHLIFSNLFPCTWTVSRSERIPPTETFRSIYPNSSLSSSSRKNAAISPTRAPWASN